MVHRQECHSTKLRREKQCSPSSIFPDQDRHPGLQTRLQVFLALRCAVTRVCASPKITRTCLHEKMSSLRRRSGSAETHKVVISKGRSHGELPLSLPHEPHISRVKFCGSSRSPRLCGRGSRTSLGKKTFCWWGQRRYVASAEPGLEEDSVP